MKKYYILLFIIIIANNTSIFSQEYTIHFRDATEGIIRINKDNNGKITIIPRMRTIFDGKEYLDSNICPILPQNEQYLILDNLRSIIIDGNTTTHNFSWGRHIKIVDGNSTTWVFSNDYWQRTVIDGNTTTFSDSSGIQHKTVVDGDTTITYYYPGWKKTVVDGNTAITTFSSHGRPRPELDDYWLITEIEGNTTTHTYSNGTWRRTVVDENTEIITFSDYGWECGLSGFWQRIDTEENTTTYTNSYGYWKRTVIEYDRFNIYVTITGEADSSNSLRGLDRSQ